MPPNEPSHDIPDDTVPPESLVATRASGRPPEESDSDCPEEQAREILEESQERTQASADRAASIG